MTELQIFYIGHILKIQENAKALPALNNDFSKDHLTEAILTVNVLSG